MSLVRVTTRQREKRPSPVACPCPCMECSSMHGLACRHSRATVKNLCLLTMNCGQEFEQSRQTGERKIIRFFPSIISVFISRIGRTSTHATVRRSARLLSVHLLDPGAYFLFSKLLGSSSDSPRSASSQLTAQGRSKDKFYWGIHPLRVKCSDVDLWQ